MTLLRARRRTAFGCAGLAASLALVLGACSADDGGSGGGGAGSGAGAPTDASLEDFCETFNGLFDQVLAEAGDQAAMVRALREWAADIEEVGTPADIPDDARHGFELFVEQAQQIDEDATLADLEQLGEDLSESDRADGDAFSDWTQDHCPLDVPALPGSSQ